MIWSVLQVLLSQETDLLVGRHLDQLIICTIYALCRVHPQSLRPINGTEERDVNNLFRDITETYTAINKKFILPLGINFLSF